MPTEPRKSSHRTAPRCARFSSAFLPLQTSIFHRKGAKTRRSQRKQWIASFSPFTLRMSGVGKPQVIEFICETLRFWGEALG